MDYGSKKVCFRELHFQPSPSVSFFWNRWETLDACSQQAPSPVYQMFRRFIMRRWGAVIHLAAPARDVATVLIDRRRLDRSKKEESNLARFIRNMPQLAAALRAVPGVEVIVQDFSLLSFPEQIALVHRSSVLLSMHGAGTTHIFHMAIGEKNCCALIELQPEGTFGFNRTQGFGNLARNLGVRHFRYVAADGRSSAEGTDVDVSKVKALVELAVQEVQRNPSCTMID